MAQALKESKEETKLTNEDEEKNQIDFIEIKHQKCNSVQLFNTLQFFEQGLYIDIRSKKEYKKSHIRSFINIPKKCKKKYAIHKIEKALSSMYKDLFIHIYCYSNKQLNNEKWYKYIHKLLVEEFTQYNFKSFNILSVDYTTFSNRFAMLITKQKPKQYEVFTRYPNIIIDNELYLGDADHAKNSNIINDLGITHIVNMTCEVECSFKYDEKLSFIKYLQCKIMDDPYTDIDQLFDKCINFIHNALNENGKNKCLVHCVAGISRSSTIVIAYLMKIKHMKYDDALEYARKQRKVVWPNNGFQRQLKSWEIRGYKALELDD